MSYEHSNVNGKGNGKPMDAGNEGTVGRKILQVSDGGGSGVDNGIAKRARGGMGSQQWQRRTGGP